MRLPNVFGSLFVLVLIACGDVEVPPLKVDVAKDLTPAQITIEENDKLVEFDSATIVVTSTRAIMEGVINISCAGQNVDSAQFKLGTNGYEYLTTYLFVHDLKEDTGYLVLVLAVDEVGNHVSKSFSFRTKVSPETDPAQPPFSLSVSGVTSRGALAAIAMDGGEPGKCQLEASVEGGNYFSVNDSFDCEKDKPYKLPAYVFDQRQAVDLRVRYELRGFQVTSQMVSFTTYDTEMMIQKFPAPPGEVSILWKGYKNYAQVVTSCAIMADSPVTSTKSNERYQDVTEISQSTSYVKFTGFITGGVYGCRSLGYVTLNGDLSVIEASPRILITVL